jgi:hypothetical protein
MMLYPRPGDVGHCLVRVNGEGLAAVVAGRFVWKLVVSLLEEVTKSIASRG